MIRTLSLLGLAAALVPAATVYTDEASFLAALNPGSFTNNFPFTLADIPQNKPSGLGFAANGFTYTITTGDGSDLYKSLNEYLGTYNSNTALTITVGADNVFAIGGNFFHSDIFDNTLFGSTLTITLDDGTVETIAPTSGLDYRGFISTVALQSITLQAAGPGLVNSIDNLTVGTALLDPNAGAVPEPSTFALALVAGAGIAIARRRR